mgnify:CR=1 FL=1
MANTTKVQPGLEAETAVIGALIYAPEIVKDVLFAVREQDFGIEINRKIFRAARDLYLRAKPVTAVTIRDKVGQESSDYLAQLYQLTMTSANWREYAAIMAEQASMRRMQEIAMQVAAAGTAQECRELAALAEKLGRKVIVGHVLRYTPFFSKIKEIISEGIIGDVVTIQAIENVGYWHQAHSFVRGNWRNSNTTSPMCLQKTCHDFDLYLWLADKTPKRVSSMGDTYFFKEACAPEGAALRCMDGCKAKENCPFDAEKIYITNKRTGIAQGNTEWPVDVLAIHPTEESIYEAIKTGPYGRCVFHCDNNVVDHQITNIENTDGSNISFSMSGFTSDGASRYCKIMGTKGDITADMTKNIIEIGLFGQPREVIDVTKLATDFSGHGGGDVRMVLEFLEMITTGKEPQGITSLEQSINSHLVAFAAEESRLNHGAPVEIG